MDGEQPIQWGEISRRIEEGDPAAEEQLGRYFHPRILAMATVRLRDTDAAREVTQETLLAVLQAVREAQLRAPDRLVAFVLGTARNLVNNRLRSESRRPHSVPLGCAETASATFPADSEQQERRVAVCSALQRLKALDRKILLLTLTEGMNPREIAPLVGLKPENVRTRKARAIKAIIRHLRKGVTKAAA